MQDSPLLASLPATDLEQLQSLAHAFAGLAPFETLQYTDGGRYKERRFRVPIDEHVIARVLAPFDLARHRITGARFALDDDMMLLHVVERGTPDPLIVESPTHAAKGR